MLTRGKRARMQLEDSSIEEGNEALPLLSLPDVPLVNVLSRLSPKDLWAVGQASPRLGALTRAHTSLWVADGNNGGSSGKLYFGDVGSILALLRVAPPVDELHYEVRRPLFLPPYVVSLTRRQLRDVRISSQLLPLLDSCPSRLQQMTVVARQGFDVGSGLQRLRGLNRLTILQLGDEQVEQVDTLLKSCRSPLENLILLLCCDQTLQTVGSIGLTSLRYILLFCGYTNQWALGSLEVALAGLPNLRTLIVGGLDDPLQELSRVPASAIPNLTLLVFQEKGRFDMDSPADYTGFRDCQDLVLRAPKSLHVGASFGGGGCIVFCRHATDEFTVASCPTCGREETEISTVAIVQVQ
ncbi:hypothetical protein FOCC_FOCC011259 [Frankliniella occidentalis]|nr:hypothetical protein FOCC_FOCC011259 [Frankliniella occidentalis]